MAEDRILEYRDDNGGIYDVPEAERDAFMKEMKDAGVRVFQYVANPKPLGNAVPSLAATNEEAKPNIKPFEGYKKEAQPFPEGDPLRAKAEDMPLANKEVQEAIGDVNKATARAAVSTPTPMEQHEAKRVEAMADPLGRADDVKINLKDAAIRRGREISEQGAEGPLSEEEEYYVRAYEDYEDEQYAKQQEEIPAEDMETYNRVKQQIADASHSWSLEEPNFSSKDYDTFRRVSDILNNDLSKRVRTRHSNQLDSDAGDIRRMLDAFERESFEQGRRHYDRNSGTWIYSDPNDKLYADNLHQAYETLRKASGVWKAPERGGYLKGMANRASDSESIPFAGVIETIMKNINERGVGSKMEAALKAGKDPASVLDESELALMASVLTLANAEQARANDTSALYKGGQSALDNLSFMAEFLVTSGTTAAAKNTIAKSIMRRLAGNGKRMSTRFARFLGESVGGPIATAYRTAIMPSTYKTISEKLVEKNDDGTYRFSPWQAVKFGALDAYIETLSEQAGEAFGRLGLGKLMDNVLGRSKWSAAVGDLLNGTNDIMRKAGVQSLGSEWGEEVYGTALRTLFPVYGPAEDQWADFFSKDNQISMLSGFGLMTGVGSVSSIARRIKTKSEYVKDSKEREDGIKKNLGELEHHLNTLSTKKAYKEKVAELIKKLPEMTAEQQADAIGALADEAESSFKGKAATFNGRWGSVKNAYKNYAIATAEKQALDESYKKAVTSFDTEDHHQDYINWDNVFDPERRRRRAEQRRNERALREDNGALSDYMSPIVPADMIEASRVETPAEEAPVAEEPQMPEPQPAQEEQKSYAQMFGERNRDAAGKPVSLADKDGNVTPIKKDDKIVGYLAAAPLSGGTFVYWTKGEDKNGNEIWKRATAKKSQGFEIGAPVEAEQAYKMILAPELAAQEDVKAGEQVVVDGDAADTEQVIDAAEQKISAEQPAAPEEKEEPAPQPEPAPEPQPENDDEAFLASLPKKGKTNNLDYAAFTPEQAVRYAAMQSDMATAVKMAEGTVANMKKRLAEIGDISSLTFDADGLSKMAEAKELSDKIAAYENIINEYRGNEEAAAVETPAAQPAADAAPAPKQVPAPKKKRTTKKATAAPVVEKQSEEEPAAAPAESTEVAEEAPAAEEPAADTPLMVQFRAIKQKMADAKEGRGKVKLELAKFLRGVEDISELEKMLIDIRNDIAEGGRSWMNSVEFQVERKLREEENKQLPEALAEKAALEQGEQPAAQSEKPAEKPKRKSKEKAEKKEAPATQEEVRAEEAEAPAEEQAPSVDITPEIDGMLQRFEEAFASESEDGEDHVKPIREEIRARVNEATDINALNAISQRLQDEVDDLTVKTSERGKKEYTDADRAHAINALKQLVKNRRNFLSHNNSKKTQARKADGTQTKRAKKQEKAIREEVVIQRDEANAAMAAESKKAAEEAKQAAAEASARRAAEEEQKKQERQATQKRIADSNRKLREETGEAQAAPVEAVEAPAAPIQEPAPKKTSPKKKATGSIYKVVSGMKVPELRSYINGLWNRAKNTKQISSDEEWNEFVKIRSQILDELNGLAAKNNLGFEYMDTNYRTGAKKGKLPETLQMVTNLINSYLKNTGKKYSDIVNEENLAIKKKHDDTAAQHAKDNKEKEQVGRLEKAIAANDKAEAAKARASLAKIGVDYRTEEQKAEDAKKDAKKAVVEATNEIGRAKNAKQYLLNEEEIRKLTPEAEREEKEGGVASNVKTPAQNRIAALMEENDKLAKHYSETRIVYNSSKSKTPFAEWLDGYIRDLEDDRANAVNASLAANQNARMQITSSDKAASLKEINRLTSRLIKFLPKDMRDKVHVLSGKEFYKRLTSEGMAQRSNPLFSASELAEMETPILQSKGTFKNFDEAEQWAKDNLQGNQFTNRHTGDKIEVNGRSIKEMLAPKFTNTANSEAHKAAVMSVPEFIENGIPAEIHPDAKGRGYDIMRLYSAFEYEGEIYRVKSTVKRFKEGDRYYTYELQEMELIEGTQNESAVGLDGNPAPSSMNSITGANLLKGVKKTNSSDDILAPDDTFLNDSGDTLGFVDKDGQCYINADNAQVTTPLHEIGIHMLFDVAKQNGDENLRHAIIQYGKLAPQEFKDHVKKNYSLNEDTDAFYEEVAAHAFATAYADRQAEFAQRSEFRELLQAIWDFIKRIFGGRYANTDVFSGVEKMGADAIGDKLYDIVMGGKEIQRTAPAQMNDAESSVRKQIIGEIGARNLDEYRGNNALMDGLEAAKKMQAEGRDMLDIKKATGWEYDAGDKHWKTEAEDAKSSSNVAELISAVNLRDVSDDINYLYDGDVFLDDLLEDGEAKEELFAMYPALRYWNIKPITINPRRGRGFVRTDGDDASIMPNFVRIGKNGRTVVAKESEIRGNLIHEIQHIIQSIEGFAAGSSTGARGRELATRLNDLAKRIDDGDLSNETLDAFSDTQDELAKLIDKQRRYAGEVESNNAEKRAGMPLRERLSTLLSSTEDVAASDKIYSFDYSGEMQQQANDAADTRDNAIDALRIDIDEMTASEWLDYLKTVGLKDKDLAYYIEHAFERGENIPRSELIDYVERRAENDDPYTKAINEALAKENTVGGKAKSFANDIWRYLKDNIVSYRTILKTLAKAGIPVAEDDNFEAWHSTQASSTGYELEGYEKEVAEPLYKAESDLVKKLGDGTENGVKAISDYMQALHAKERNRELVCRKVAERVNAWAEENGMGITVTADDIKPFYDGGVISGMAPEVADRITSILDRKYPDEESRNMSGWTDSEADEYIEDFEQRVLDAGAEAELGAYIDAVKAANKFAVDYAYSHGIISEEAHDMYLNQYENYVPLIDWEDDADREANESFRSAGGWNIELSREAKGRQTRAANVTAAIVYRGINTIVNGKENESRSALHRMILNAPGASALFFIEGQEAPQWAKDMKKEDLEKHSVSVYVDGRPTKMYFAGEAGRNLSYGLDRYFTFSQKVIGNSKGGKLAWKTLGDLNAFRSQILTTFDPAFNIRNLARDMGFAARQMFVSHGAKGMRLWAKNLTDSISDIYNYQFGLPVSPEFEAYLANGGRIGYSTMKTLDEVKRQHMRSMEKITSGKKDRTGSGAVAGMFEGIASSFESISRYAAFRAAKEMGMSDKHAAYVAHEAATDLSRHGNQTALSRTTLFFNASLEGANQVIRNYTSGGEVAARQGICTAISMALHVAAIKMIEQVARAMFSNAGGDDDDLKAMPTLMSRLPEYIKRGQLVWPLSVDKYGRVTGIKIDLPFQYRVNGYAAQRIVEAIQGDADWGDVYHDIINAYIAEYDPLAGSAPGERNNEDAFTLSPVELTPDAFKPVAEAIFNMNNYGRNVYTRYEMGSGKATRAAWSLAKPGTDKTAIAISKFLGGKDETKRKGIQIRPEVIEHIFDGYLGWIAQGVGHLDNNPRYEQAYDANGKPLVNQLTNEPILEHKGGFTEPEYQRYGQREPLVQRFVYNGTRDLGYSLLRDWEKESVEEKEAVAKATADDFRELMNVTNEQRKAIVNDAAVDCGYKSYESMARDVKKLEKSYRDNIRRAADPTLMAPMRRSADNGARRELEAIMEIHYRFAKAYYKRQKDNQ